MNHLLTKYGEQIQSNHVLQEYPRPQLRRSSYLNLNGYWDFAISNDKTCHLYDKKILVPFSPESVLSGINEVLEPSMFAHYKKEVIFNKDFVKDITILHFGAVDQTCDLYIDDKYVLTHVGGYVPFSVDISPYINHDLKITIKLIVSDLSDTSYHLTGKQRLKHEGIFYTPQSGIWQTVWIESVNKDYIKDIKIKPLYDESAFSIEVQANQFKSYKVNVYSKEEHLINTFESSTPQSVISIPNFIPWTPENPYLYNLEIIHGEDQIKTYVGMRHFERKKRQKWGDEILS